MFSFFSYTAPGTYDVEKSEKILQHHTGAVTFGIKYKEHKPDDIPGKWKNSFSAIYNILIIFPFL